MASTKTRQYKSERARLISKIHALKRQLNWGDDRYRACLMGIAGVESCSDITSDGELLQVSSQMAGELDRLKRPQYRQGSGDKNRISEGQIRYVHGLWNQLVDLGVFDNKSNGAIDTFVYRQTGVARLEWVKRRDVNKVLGALKDKVAKATGGTRE